MLNKWASCLIFLILSIFCIINITNAEVRTFVKEYTYQASEADSKQSSRVLALEQAKRMLLEELGTYLESETEVKNFHISSDRIKILTAGVVSTRIVDEKWDGKQYWLKAVISADPNEVARSIDALRNDYKKLRELNETNVKLKSALDEIEKLKKDIKENKSNIGKSRIIKEYNNKISALTTLGLFSDGVNFLTDALLTGNYSYYQKAIDAFLKVIKLDPQNVQAYTLCASTYGASGKHKQSIDISNKLIKMKPRLADGYFSRGIAHSDLGNYTKAIQDYETALKYSPSKWEAFYFKGLAYFNKRDYSKAIDELDIAINMLMREREKFIFTPLEIDKDSIKISTSDWKEAPKASASTGKLVSIDELTDDIILKSRETIIITGLSDSYGLRGRSYFMLNNKTQAINDFTQAINLLPESKSNALIYLLRGSATYTCSTIQQSIEDMSKAISLDKKNPAYYQDRGTIYSMGGMCLAAESYERFTKGIRDEDKNTASQMEAYKRLADDDFKTADAMGYKKIEEKERQRVIAEVRENDAAEGKKLKKAKIIREGQFIAYDNGTVLDTNTKLMWASKDNGSNINWASAKSYCENYRGGGYTDWRMPTQDELTVLYDSSKSRALVGDTIIYIHVATTFIRLTSTWVWATDTGGSDVTSLFGFHLGKPFWPHRLGDQAYDHYCRALPVRSGK